MAVVSRDDFVTQVSMQGVQTMQAQQTALAGGFTKMGKSMSFAQGASALAATGIGASLGIIVKGSIDEALEATRVQTQLGAALRQNMGIYGAAADEITRYAESLSAAQGKSPFGDEEIKNAIAILASFRDVSGKAMSTDQIKAYLPAIMNMSVGLRKAGKENSALGDVAIMVGKAHQGMITSLRRSGVMIDVNRYKANGYNEVIAELNREFGGQYTAAMGTAEGQTTAAADAIAELKESIGMGLLPALTKINIIVRKVANGMSWLNEQSHGALSWVAGGVAILVTVAGAAATAAFAWNQLAEALGRTGAAAAGATGPLAAAGAAAATSGAGAQVGAAGGLGGKLGGVLGTVAKSAAMVMGGAFVRDWASKQYDQPGAEAPAGSAKRLGYAVKTAGGTIAGDALAGAGIGRMAGPLGAAIGAIAGGLYGVYDTKHQTDLSNERRKAAWAEVGKTANPKDTKVDRTNKILEDILAEAKDKRVIAGGGARTRNALNRGDVQRAILGTLAAATI